MKSILRCLLCCGLGLSNVVGAHFATLQELHSFADTHPERVASDNNDWADPRFANFYAQYRPTWFSSIKNFLGLSSMPQFDPAAFRDLLMRVNQQRKQRQHHAQKKITLRMKDGERCVFFGDLYGAYHSLVRDLHELKKLGIIDDQLVVTQKDVHIVFLGNVVNRSPYSLEILTVVLQLMEKNPEHVIYLHGQEELDGYWENFSLRRELQAYATSVMQKSDGTIPLRTEINRLFDSLPRLVEIYRIGDVDPDVIYCAHHHITEQELSGAYTQAAIYGEYYGNSSPLRVRDGLDFLGFIYGTAQWSVMSSPTQLYKEFFNFYYDAFVIFEMTHDIKESIITLYNRDTRLNKEFKATMYDLIFSREITGREDFTSKSYFTKKPFEFGTTLDLKGVTFSLGQGVKQGIDAAIQEQNMRENLDSYFIRPNVFEDSYKPNKAAKNMERLIYDYKISTGLASVGTETLLSYMDKINNGEITVFFPITGATLLCDPELKNIIHFRASYADEVCALIDNMIREHSVKNFAFFYQNDEYGKNCLAAAGAELTKRGITEWTEIPYAREQRVFKNEVEKLKNANPSAIGCFSVSLITQKFLDAIGAEYLKNKYLFGVSFLESVDLRRFLEDRGLKYTFSFVVPHPATSDLPLVKKYRDAMQKYGFRLDSNSLEGWITEHILFDALQHISEPLTNQKIMAYLEGLKNYKLDGLTLTFNSKTRSFDQPVFVENEDNMLIEYQACKPVKPA